MSCFYLKKFLKVKGGEFFISLILPGTTKSYPTLIRNWFLYQRDQTRKTVFDFFLLSSNFFPAHYLLSMPAFLALLPRHNSNFGSFFCVGFRLTACFGCSFVVAAPNLCWLQCNLTEYTFFLLLVLYCKSQR